MSTQQAGIVTPEAVRLEFEGASLGSRAPALLIDLLLQAVVFFGVLLAGAGVSGQIGQAPEWVGVTLVLLLTFATFWGYPVLFETLWRGRTPGKAAMGLRVVTKEGAPVRVRHAAIRAAFAPIDIYATLGAVGVVAILASSRSQRLGDLVAGTLVLRERISEQSIAPVQFRVPPGAESYAATVDPGGLSADDYATVRSFLLRANSLAAPARARLGTELAQRLAAKLSHSPPAGVSPELFLVVAAARYQQRFDRAAAHASTPAPVPSTAPAPAPAPASPPSSPAADASPPSSTFTDAPSPQPPSPESASADGGFAPPS